MALLQPVHTHRKRWGAYDQQTKADMAASIVASNVSVAARKFGVPVSTMSSWATNQMQREFPKEMSKAYVLDKTRRAKMKRDAFGVVSEEMGINRREVIRRVIKILAEEATLIRNLLEE